MKYGLYINNSSSKNNWMRESDGQISIWESIEEADKWRKNHTVFPNKYTVKKVNKKVIEEDLKDES